MTEQRKNLMRSGKLSRRRVLGTGAAATAGVASFALVGCGDDDDDADPTAAPTTNGGETPSAGETPTETATEEPTRGGVLNVGATADYNMSTGFPFVFLAENPHLNYLPVEAMVRYRDSLEPELVLAERYEFNDDQSGLVVTLKPDLEFHNGAPVTAEDVVFGINLIQDPASFGVTGAFQLATFARRVTEANILSEREVEFTFDQPRPNMGDFFAQLNVIHAASYDQVQAGQAVNGTGPYKFERWTTGQFAEFSANENWHDSGNDGGPLMDGIRVQFFGDQDAMGLAYDAGELDLIMGAPAALARNYRDDGLTFNAPKTGLQYLGMNVTNPLLEDSRVRRAIFHAIDRERVANEFGEGFSNITSQPWPSTSPAFDPSLEEALYNPEEARSLLEQAGFSQDAPINFHTRTTASYVTLASIIQQNLTDVGINVELVPTDPTAFLGLLRDRQFDGLWVTAHSFAHMSPLTNFQQTFPYQVPNISYYESETYLDIIAQLETMDPNSEEALAQYARFNELWLEDPWIAPVAESARLDLVSERVRGWGNYFVVPSQAPIFARVSLA